MIPLVLLASLGAGVGLSSGLAFNLRLTRALGTPIAASLVNFVVGALLLLALHAAGVGVGLSDRGVLAPWMLFGGVLGACYVMLGLRGAARLGAGVSTVAVTLGQVLGGLVIGSAGWLGQTPRPIAASGVVSAVLLCGAVAVLARDRARTECRSGAPARAGV